MVRPKTSNSKPHIRSEGLSEATHLTHQYQHFGASVSISNEFIAVGCPRCNGNNRCAGRCIDGSFCGRCNETHTTECIEDAECPTGEFCEVNRCRDGSYCTLWTLEQYAGKVFLYKNIGANAWKYLKEVTPQPTGGFDNLQHNNLGGNFCGNYAQGVCGTDGTVVCTTDSDCSLAGGICAGGSNGGNSCTSDAQCPGTGKCSTTCGGLNIDPLLWTCCRDGDNFGASVSIYYDTIELDYLLAVGTPQDTTSVTYGESYDRRNHGSVYLFQSDLCCMNGSTYATSGSECGVPAQPNCTDVFGQVKGLLSSGRPHEYPVTPATTCGKINYNGNQVPWVSPHVENLLQYYCWHTEKITAIDEDQDTFFGRQVYLGQCDTYLGSNGTCLMVQRGKLYGDELYIYARNKPGYVFSSTGTSSGTGTGFNQTQFGYGSDFKNQWSLHRKHCDANYQCPPTDNSGVVQSSSEATGCKCSGGFRSGELCVSDEDCQGGNQNDANYSFSGNCHDGQDQFGAECSYACECNSGLLCSWHAGSLGGEASFGVTGLRWTYSTTLTDAISASCPGGVTDSGTLTAVQSSTIFKLASTAAGFEGIYVGFTIEMTTTTNHASGEGSFNNTETRVIVGYTADRVVTVSVGFGATPTTSTTYKVKTSNNWDGYPTSNTDCPGFTDVLVAAATNLNNGSYILIDEEIFQIVGSGGGTNLTTRRARSGTIVASHAVGAAVHIISGTGVSNFGIEGSDAMLAALQGGVTLQTGGVLRRCATITLDPFKASSTDNIYRNWYFAITSGVGVAQSGRILHYDGDLKVAVIDCIAHGQEWTGYAQAGYSSGFTGQGYGEFSTSGNTATACRRSWITPPAASFRYYRFRVLKAKSGWTDQYYSPGFSCTSCCLANGWSIQEFQMFKDTVAVIPVKQKITISTATNPATTGSSNTASDPTTTASTRGSAASYAIDDCPPNPGNQQFCPGSLGYTTNLTCDANAVSCGATNATAFYQLSYNETDLTCSDHVLPPLILDLGPSNAQKVDYYRFATTMWDSAVNFEPLRWMLEGTNDGTAAGGDAYDPYGYCGAGLNLNSTGACRCSSAGTPYCSTDPNAFTPNCFCRSRWVLLHDMAKEDYSYTTDELVRGAFVPATSNTFWAGYFSVPKSTYQLCQNYVDSNGVCNQGPCNEVACSGPTGDVDPLATDYLRQARAYARQYVPNTNVKGPNEFDVGTGTTSGGALGADITGKPFWGNPTSADRASSTSGRAEDDLMAVGDYSYDDKGAVFLMTREPYGDYLSYFERYNFYPMPLPSWVD